MLSVISDKYMNTSGAGGEILGKRLLATVREGVALNRDTKGWRILWM